MESGLPFPGVPPMTHNVRKRPLLVLAAASLLLGAPAARCQTAPAVPGVPLEQLAPQDRRPVGEVLARPTLTAESPTEVFACQPATYRWLLEHPDQAARIWRQLGAKVAGIEDTGTGQFLWRDELGSQVRWRAVLRGPRKRVWYAEGRIRPGRLLPSVGVKAVAVLDHAEGYNREGHPAVRQQFHLVLQADSRAVALATRLLGSSAPRMARNYARQLALFFGALAWYLDEHPGRAVELFRAVRLPTPPGGALPFPTP
jgi:hypothetical protein